MTLENVRKDFRECERRKTLERVREYFRECKRRR